MLDKTILVHVDDSGRVDTCIEIAASIARQRTDGDIGNAMLSLAADLTSGLLVMGCYGHSRFREMVLGGVTRAILHSVTIPVLMSH